jgi:hypothetical protein
MYVMKKFYLLIMALVGYAATFAQPLNGDCPGTLSAKFYQVTLNPPFYKLFITGGPSTAVTGYNPPGAVTLKALNGSIIPYYTSTGTSTNPVLLETNGSATIEYDGTYIDRIEINYWTGTAPNQILHECWYRPGAGGSLPIKLSGFNGRLNTETEATLAWTSSLEENSFQYEVQRSADGKNFVTVGKVSAAGTSLEAVKYSFNDPLPANGGYWYRLNMVDIDGKTELSKVVYVNSKKGSGIVTKLFPNPFTSEVQLIGATSADLNTQGNIKVFNMAGQQIKFQIVGANAIAIDRSAPTGMYILKIKDQTFKLTKR